MPGDRLEPQGEADAAEYLAAVSSGGGLPDGLASLLYQLFMVLALALLAEQGLLSRENGTWPPRAFGPEE